MGDLTRRTIEIIDSFEAEVATLTAERDRLRLIVERALDHVTLDEHVLRTMHVDDLVALIGVLRRDCAELRESARLAHAAADAGAEAVGNMAGYASQAVAERDRLRAVVDAVRPLWDDLTDADEDGTVKQFPSARYQAVDEALDALDVSGDMGGDS